MKYFKTSTRNRISSFIVLFSLGILLFFIFNRDEETILTFQNEDFPLTFEYFEDWEIRHDIQDSGFYSTYSINLKEVTSNGEINVVIYEYDKTDTELASQCRPPTPCNFAVTPRIWVDEYDDTLATTIEAQNKKFLLVRDENVGIEGMYSNVKFIKKQNDGKVENVPLYEITDVKGVTRELTIADFEVEDKQDTIHISYGHYNESNFKNLSSALTKLLETITRNNDLH